MVEKKRKMVQTSLFNYPTKRIRVDKYTRVVKGKKQGVSGHDKDVHVKPKSLSKTAKARAERAKRAKPKKKVEIKKEVKHKETPKEKAIKRKREIEKEIILKNLTQCETHRNWIAKERELKELTEELEIIKDNPAKQKELYKKINELRNECNELYETFRVIVEDEILSENEKWEDEFYSKIRTSDRYRFKTLEQLEKEKGEIEKVDNPLLNNLFRDNRERDKVPVMVQLSPDGEKVWVTFDNYGPDGRKVSSSFVYDDYMAIVRRKYKGKWNSERKSYTIDVNDLENVLEDMKNKNYKLNYAIIGDEKEQWRERANIPMSLIVETELRHILLETAGNKVLLKGVEAEKAKRYLNAKYTREKRKRQEDGTYKKILYKAVEVNNKGEFVFDIGLLTKAYWYLDTCGLNPAVADMRPRSPITNPDIKDITLYDFQKKAVAEALIEGQGLMVSPTGSGKTEIAAGIIGGYIEGAKEMEERTGKNVETDSLFFVHRGSLGDQAEERIEKRLGIDVGRLTSDKDKYDPKNTKDSDVNVSTIQGMYAALKRKEHGEKLTDRHKEMLAILKGAEVIIQDEAHHIIAESFDNVYSQNDTVHKYGLTATPSRKEQDEIMRIMKIGDKRQVTTFKELQQKGFLMRPKIIEYKIPRSQAMREESPKKWWDKKSAQIENNDKRNYCIINQANEFNKENKTTIIFTATRRHAKLLSEMLKEQHGIDAPVLIGAHSKKEESKLKKDIKRLETGEINIATGTASLLGEGFDMPGLDVLQIADANGYSKIQVLQKAGRVMRIKKGKKQPLIIEYNDLAPTFSEHMSKRRKHYQKTGAFDYELKGFPKEFEGEEEY